MVGKVHVFNVCRAAILATAVSVSPAVFAGPAVDTSLRGGEVALSAAVASYHRQAINVRIAPDQTLEAVVEFGGVQRSLRLLPYSIRASNFEVIQVGADGVMTKVATTPARTYRGSILGEPGSFVSATWNDGALAARIELPSGERWHVSPIASSTGGVAAGVMHAVYAGSEVQVPSFSCGAVGNAPKRPLGATSQALAAQMGPPRVADIAFDADFEFYVQNASSVSRTVADIESVMNEVSAVYEASFGLSYEITTIVVRTANPDPYTATDNRDLLDEIAAEWNTNMQHVRRDVMHLMTGKTIDAGVIGTANIDVICDVCGDARGYGFSQSRFSLVPALRTCLTVHELGHNWGADHCDGDPDCATMCSAIDACGGACGQFGTTASNAIATTISNASCISAQPSPLELPFCDTFGGSVDPVRWPYVVGASIVSGELFAPSAPLVLELDACCAGCTSSPAPDEIRSNVIRLGAVAQAGINYHIRFDGDAVTVVEELVVEYQSSDGGWVLLESLDGTDPAFDSYRFTSLPLPSGALHDEFRFRFRVTGIDPSARWLLDDVTVSSATAGRPVLFVRSNAPTGGSGATWGDALTDLQDALAAAECSLGVVEEIWVAEGVYTPDRGTGDRTSSFGLLNDVQLLGGFRGDEVDRDDRKPDLYATVLSGEIGNAGSTVDNSYHVIDATGVTGGAVMDGFVVTGGNANGLAPNDVGGGMVITPGSPTIRRCRFVDNSATRAGGIFAQFGGSPTITLTAFFDNTATNGAGGALFAEFGSSPILDGCVFGRNSALTSGGAIWVSGSSVTVSSSVFSGNSAGVGGAIAGAGAALMFENCTIAGNDADLVGGGVSASGSNVTLMSTILWGNTDASGSNEASQLDGGGITVDYSTVQGWSGSLGGAGNDGTDPNFRDAVGVDLIAGTLDDDLRPSASSTAINTGDPTRVSVAGEFDIGGGPRVLCGTVDRGAYESGVGDYDCNGAFSPSDLLNLAACVSGPDSPFLDAACTVFDADSDGDVDTVDVGLVLATFSSEGS